MRNSRAKQAALLLGFGLGAFFEAILMHPLGGLLYLGVWALCVAGVVLLWAAVRGPGPLPSGQGFAGAFFIGWGIFNMLEGLLRHDLAREWLVFATGLGFALLGAILSRIRDDRLIERRSGCDRRSGSPVR
jgi:uncharacterized membrane protein